MARLGEAEARPETRDEIRSGPAAAAAASPAAGSIWPSIHPRLVELIRAHRSTMIFVNSRRLAERLAGDQRDRPARRSRSPTTARSPGRSALEIEDRLKRGELPAIVATSSLELGIDMGAVDLVIQIEAPPSVASGMQRIGRAGHTSASRLAGSSSRSTAAICSRPRPRRRGCRGRGRGDALPAQSAGRARAADRRDRGVGADPRRRAVPPRPRRRAVRRAPARLLRGRARHALGPLSLGRVRRAAAADHLGPGRRRSPGARRGAPLAVVNAGTIPDRGLYGVFLAPASRRAEEHARRRAGRGDGVRVAAGRRVRARRLVVADRGDHARPGAGLAGAREPGKMPFWHGDRPGRPTEFGRAIGALARELAAAKPDAAAKRLREEHGLDAPRRDEPARLPRRAGRSDRRGAERPDDRRRALPRRDRRLASLRALALGARVHAPWATAALARAAGIARGRRRDHVVGRRHGLPLPRVRRAAGRVALPAAGGRGRGPRRARARRSSLFAARFRENAARALLLPRRHPGRRRPLWAQRKRAADLLAVAARYGSFPIILETYRECLRDVFDLPGLKRHPAAGSRRASIRVVTRDTRTPSPFAASLLFSYVANFIYDGDAPLAERRAQALSVDQAQLRELLGEAELRELLDPEAIESLERSLQRLEGRHVRHADGLHDLLLSLGDLSEEEIRARTETPEEAPRWLEELVRERRVIPVRIAGEARFAAAEDAGRLRDALGIVPPPGLPDAFLEPAAERRARHDLVSRYARTHGPFRLEDAAARWGLPVGVGAPRARRLAERGRVIEGDFLPGGRSREWSDVGTLRAHQAAFAREAAARGRARRAGGVRPLSRGVAGRRGAARGPRSASLRRRAAPGLPDSRVRPRDRGPSGAGRALPAGGPGRPAARRARSSGAASSRSARRTGGSRST